MIINLNLIIMKLIRLMNKVRMIMKIYNKIVIILINNNNKMIHTKQLKIKH